MGLEYETPTPDGQKWFVFPQTSGVLLIDQASGDSGGALEEKGNGAPTWTPSADPFPSPRAPSFSFPAMETAKRPTAHRIPAHKRTTGAASGRLHTSFVRGAKQNARARRSLGGACSAAVTAAQEPTSSSGRSSGGPIPDYSSIAIDASRSFDVSSPLKCEICSPKLTADSAYALSLPDDTAVPAELAKEVFGYDRGLHKNYNMGDVIGRGSFGVVRAAASFEDPLDECLAVKSVPKLVSPDGPMSRRWTGALDGTTALPGAMASNAHATSAKVLRKISNEVNILSRLRHCKDVVTLHGAYEDDKKVHLVQDRVRGPSLETVLAELRQANLVDDDGAGRRRLQRGLPLPAVSAILASVLRVLSTCHRQGIVFRDVTPNNFLFTDDEVLDVVNGISGQDPATHSGAHLELRCVDCGLAVNFLPDCTPELDALSGTPIFMAPEVILRRYGYASDLWSAGIFLFAMVEGGRYPFWGGHKPVGEQWSMKNIWFETILAEVEYDDDVWRDDASLTVGDADGELTYAMARDLCEKLLRRDPRKRITARQALKHPFLRRQSEKV